MSKHANIDSNDDSTTEIGQPLPSTLITPEGVAPIDLPTVDVASVTGGSDGGTFGGSLRLNHNQPTQEDMEDDMPKVALDDLPIPDDAAVALSGGGDGGTYGGSIRLNHNEPLTADTDEA